MIAPVAARAKREKTPSCRDCFFHKNMLCALALESACPTFRPDTPQGLMPPRQPVLLTRQDGPAPVATTI
jgi:hypothetical protein